jgi:hypothetical protein
LRAGAHPARSDDAALVAWRFGAEAPSTAAPEGWAGGGSTLQLNEINLNTMEHTADENTNQTQARALLADIQGAPTTLIPRREPIVGWLTAFLLRSDRTGYVMGATEADDLIALDQFLRTYQVPIAGRTAA